MQAGTELRDVTEELTKDPRFLAVDSARGPSHEAPLLVYWGTRHEAPRLHAPRPALHPSLALLSPMLVSSTEERVRM